MNRDYNPDEAICAGCTVLFCIAAAFVIPAFGLGVMLGGMA